MADQASVRVRSPCRRAVVYLVATLLAPVLFLYPAGMGGYDGFATPQMMLKHGAWAPADSPASLVYRAFEGLYLLWLLSLLNLPVALTMLSGESCPARQPRAAEAPG